MEKLLTLDEGADVLGPPARFSRRLVAERRIRFVRSAGTSESPRARSRTSPEGNQPTWTAKGEPAEDGAPAPPQVLPREARP